MFLVFIPVPGLLSTIVIFMAKLQELLVVVVAAVVFVTSHLLFTVG